MSVTEAAQTLKISRATGYEALEADRGCFRLMNVDGRTPFSMPTTASGCPDCGTSGLRQLHYDHVHGVEELPRVRHSDGRVVVHGYAVGFGGSGGLPWTVVFFADLEPAIVFGRAGRMSVYDISTYDVDEAAREQRYDESLHRDVVTLYLKAGSELRDHPNERPILERWVRGCDPNSAYYEGPRPTA